MNPEPTIQVDMFEVQLGAALLLQFQTAGGDTVRVLADGGKGPPVRDIRPELFGAMQAFGDRKSHIDLMIGTHYDADHLDGLVPVIEDTSITITEAWLPPVANDVDPHAFDEPLGDHQLLAHQFYSPDGQPILAHYLDAKAQICQLLRPIGREGSAEVQRVRSAEEDELKGLRERFERYRDEALQELRPNAEYEAYTHADENSFDPATLQDLSEQMSLPLSSWSDRRWINRQFSQLDLTQLVETIRGDVQPRSITAQNLAGIRKSAASQAINAISLNRVARCLRSRGIPIRCRIIENGAPRRFVWRSGSRRFEGGRHLSEQGPTLLLLGPSEALVRKHRDRLPIGTYSALAFYSPRVLKNITPSNQLSYVMRFSAENQGILVSGDGGCVDFTSTGKPPYYTELVEALSPLHVVQVAHHAGNNKHFYEVLKAAQYPLPSSQSFLLVSHATHDRYRPSHEFRDFLEDIRHEPEIVSVLFTTQPLPEKIHDFESLVYPNVGPPTEESDARLEFQKGAWTVTQHVNAIADSPRADTGEPSVALANKMSVGPPYKLIERKETKQS